MAARLRAVPEQPRRFIGMIRVSDEADRGDDLLSPEIQRAAITDAAARRGYEVVGWVEGIDESGSKAKSPWWAKLDESVERVERGEVDGILVWKFSRAARHRLRWAVAIDRTESAGGLLESATEDVDVTTSVGRFARGMLGELNAFEAERIGEGWKEAHATRIRSGRPHSGGPRWGYVYDREAKTYVVDEETGPLLAEMYRRYIAGESATTLAYWLNAHGHRTVKGNLWRANALFATLDSGFGAGLFLAGGDAKAKVAPTHHQGVHEPVISEAVWQDYKDARARRSTQHPRSAASPWVLSGIGRCGHCGGRLSVGLYGSKGREVPYMRCVAARWQGPAACENRRYIPLKLVEGALLDWLQEVATEVTESAERQQIAQARKVSRASEAERLAREVTRIDGELSRLAIANARTPLPESVYDRTVAELMEQRQTLEHAALDASQDARAVVADVATEARALLLGWETRPVAHRREVLSRLMKALWVWVDDTADGGFRIEPDSAWGTG